MPSETHRLLYKDYLLSYAPMRRENGAFQARVAITYLGQERTRSQRFLDLQDFATEIQAIEHARRAGMEWVDRAEPY